MKKILFCFLFFSIFKIYAQENPEHPWNFQFALGYAMPLNIKNENGADLDIGPNSEFAVDYHFSESYFVSLKYNYAKHGFSDLYSLKAFPFVRSHNLTPMIGKNAQFGKLDMEGKCGFGMLYARIPAYLSQKIGEYYFAKSTEESRTLIAEFDFTAIYTLPKNFSVFFKTDVKYSQIKWDIQYNGFIQSNIGLDIVLSDMYTQKVMYLPIVFSLGVAYKL